MVQVWRNSQEEITMAKKMIDVVLFAAGLLKVDSPSGDIYRSLIIKTAIFVPDPIHEANNKGEYRSLES